MPDQLDSLLQKRQILLQELQTIDRLRRGSLSKQFFKAAPGHSGQRGPYFVLQGFFHGKKFSQRIPTEQAAQVQEQVDNYRRFQVLAEEYVTLSDEITRLEGQGAGGKKNSSRKKSRRNNSSKPKPS
jgi:hypothetical protein